jgi:putative ABC transport system permease protein
MQSGNVNGVDYTVNVMDQPEYFHILSGRSCFKNDEIIITETVARDLGIKTGASVTVSEKGKNAVYTVSGIYECANQMGGNIGMSRDGYAKIGDVNAYIWCHHYILEDRTAAETIVKEIQERFRAEVSVHTNSWSGLSGIVRTLHLLTWFMYLVSAAFIILTAGLTGRGFLKEEQSDMAVYKSLGFTSQWLQLSFAVRYSIAALPGALAGAVLAAAFADPIITLLLKNFGIAVFHSGNALYVLILPTLGMIVLFSESAVFVSRKIRKTNLISLIAD